MLKEWLLSRIGAYAHDSGHLLVIPQAPAWTYNLRPREADLERAAAQVGVAMEEVGRLPDDAAVLYAVDSQTDLP